MQARGNRADPSRPVTSLWAGLQPVLLGRETERRRLHSAILSGDSLVIEGPTGIGKTALVSHVIRCLPERVASRCLYIPGVKNLQDLLRQLTRALHEVEDTRLPRQLQTERASSLSLDRWLKELPTSRLRGTVYRGVEGGNYRIFLDHLPPLTHGIAKVIKELFWMRGTPVYLVPQAEGQLTISRFFPFFYWGDQERLMLGPLTRSAAKELLEICIERFGLTRLDLIDFRKQVLDLSKHVPGAITKMCALAARPKYQFRSGIKVKSAYIGYLLTGHE